MFNRQNAPAAVIAFMKSQLGKPYSEHDPAGSEDDGHEWQPGEALPNHYDCSGLEVTGWLQVGVLISRENALAQFNQALGGRFAPSSITSGDTLYFNGSQPPVGHVGTCLTFDAATGTGTYISAYDTTEGVAIHNFSIHVTTGSGGLVGVVRTANALPAPPPPPPPPPIPKPAPNPAPVTVGDLMLLHDINLVLQANGQGAATTKIPYAQAVSATILAGEGPVEIDEVSLANAAGNTVVVVKGGPAASKVTVRVAQATS